MDYFDMLKDCCDDLKISFDENKCDKFMKYKELLKIWNKKINLTSIDEDEQIVKKHFIDSINIFNFSSVKNFDSIIDVGTGAGFPGIPIAVMQDHSKVVLLDSLSKRINFLNQVVTDLKLNNVFSVHGRAEDFGKMEDYREKFDAAVSRAVGSLNVLSEFCVPFVKVGGYFIAMKGPSVAAEVECSKNAIDILGGKIEDIIEIKDDEFKHNLVIIKKVKNTPLKYPRRAGIVGKRPLK